MKRKYLPLGAKVRVVTPKVFVRCGYPLNFDEVSRKFSDEITERINKASYAAKLNQDDRYVSKYLFKAVVCDILKREKFGGLERQIFEEEEKHIEGAIGFISGKKFVKTGKYERGYQSYDGDGDWDPAYLSDEKTHCIYTLELTNRSLSYLQVRAIYCEEIQSVTSVTPVHAE